MRFSGYEVSNSIINNRDFLFMAGPGEGERKNRKSKSKMVLENLNINAGVAQLAAQLICNQSAIGSSPITSSIISARMAVVISLANLLY